MYQEDTQFGQPAMPELIATAVNTVMRGVRTLLKTERNGAAGYRFASIDGFLSAINPLCAKAELIIVQNELDARLVHNGTDTQDRSWLWTTFEFHLAHTSGAMWGPITRSVMVAADGAQAFGAAQSYALKQFMRAMFQIPTGEAEDADHETPVRPTRIVQRRPEIAKAAVGRAARPSNGTHDSGRREAGPLRSTVTGSDTREPSGIADEVPIPAPGDSRAAPDGNGEERSPRRVREAVHGDLFPDQLPDKRLDAPDSPPPRRRPNSELWPYKTPHPLTARRPTRPWPGD